jgi:hypothetical protein
MLRAVGSGQPCSGAASLSLVLYVSNPIRSAGSSNYDNLTVVLGRPSIGG